MATLASAAQARFLSRRSRTASPISLCRSHYPVNRNIWTSRTLVTNDPEKLVKALPSDAIISKSALALFTISRNVPRDSLSALVKRFQGLPIPAIGCLSLGSDGSSGPYSISYAFHQPPDDRLEMIVPFRSTIQGTPKIALGREVGRMERRLETMEWAGDDSVVPDELPEELRSLE